MRKILLFIAIISSQIHPASSGLNIEKSKLIHSALCTTGMLSFFYRWNLCQHKKTAKKAVQIIFDRMLLDTHPDSTERTDFLILLNKRKYQIAAIQNRLDTANILVIAHLIYLAYHLGARHASE